MLKVCFFLLCFVHSIHAVEGGYSNYIPGLYGDFEVALPSKQGFSIRNDLYYYQAKNKRNQLNLIDGEFVNSRIEETIISPQNLTALFYTFTGLNNNVTISTGIQNTLARVYIRNVNSSTLENSRQTKEVTGFGDLAIIPITIFWQQQHIYNSLSLAVTVPTSSYNKNNLANLSANYWSLDVSWAFTYLNNFYDYEISFVPGVIYNTKNEANNYHSGTEIHLEYMLNKKISKNFSIGLQGYFMNQLIKDKSKDPNFDGIKTKAQGIGPSLMLTDINNSSFSIIFKWLNEYLADNRIKKGENLFLSIIYEI